MQRDRAVSSAKHAHIVIPQVTVNNGTKPKDHNTLHTAVLVSTEVNGGKASWKTGSC